MFDGVDYIAHRPDGLEILRLNPLSRHLLDMNRQINSVDAVQVELFKKLRFGNNTLRGNFNLKSSVSGVQFA